MPDNVTHLGGPTDPESFAGTEFSACLRVASKTLDLADLTFRLGPSTRGHSIGQMRADGLTWEHTVWMWDAPGDNTKLEPLLEEVVTFAESRAPALAELRRDCGADVCCSLYPGMFTGCGAELDASLLHRLGALDLALGLSVCVTE